MNLAHTIEFSTTSKNGSSTHIVSNILSSEGVWRQLPQIYVYATWSFSIALTPAREYLWRGDPWYYQVVLAENEQAARIFFAMNFLSGSLEMAAQVVINCASRPPACGRQMYLRVTWRICIVSKWWNIWNRRVVALALGLWTQLF